MQAMGYKVEGRSAWPIWLDPKDDPLVLRNMAKVGYTFDEADCDFLLNLAKNIELDFAAHPTENTMAALDETINLVLQWMGHPALEVAGFKEGRIPVDVRQAWRNDFRLALIALNRLKGEGETDV